jgi:hypothetical protein
MPKQKIELSNEQKNIAKRFLLCNRPTCIKDDGQTAVATRLCAFCYKVGYCCTQCMNKDISRHVENECQKNLNSAPPTQASSSEKPLNDTKLQTKQSPGKNGILRLDTVNVNDYLSGSESSGTEEEAEPQQKPRKSPSRSTSRTRNRTKK